MTLRDQMRDGFSPLRGRHQAKYGGMDVSDAKRLKALEDENARLKKLLADQMLEASALKELLAKKW
jgi:putative transposase